MGTSARPPAFAAPDIDFDVPLQPESALGRDLLSRRGFAEIAASSLTKVSESAGLVLSVEGAWGSGKSSTLAMIQALLEKDTSSRAPIIVHFNPWLIGEKDALLRQLLFSIAKAIKLSDNSRDGKKVAKELKAYSKVFDLVKLIPGAEPWASMVKSVVEAAGDATSAVAEYKTPDIEAYKLRVEAALKKFDRPLVVFIDDIDRLFPAEVFEMIRIIKAVGGLPRVGYVVAWDAAYVSGALQNLQVPYAHSYLDKVVQVRMSLPNLSLRARARLFDSAMERVDLKALAPFFKTQHKRLGLLYHSGLRDLLAQPRDVARVFNAVRIMEPLLRGEIVFADILGLAALSVKAPSVFELLKRKPRFFVGRLAHDVSSYGANPITAGTAERREAYDAAEGDLTREVVHLLFPEVALAEDGRSLGKGAYADGVVADPARLLIALQLSLTDADVSISTVRDYLQSPHRRGQILSELSVDNCEEFVDMLGDVGKSLGWEQISDMDEACLAIARLADEKIFVHRSRSAQGSFRIGIEDLALKKIKEIVMSGDPGRITPIYEKIAADPEALSCSAEILRRSYIQTHNQQDVVLDETRRAVITQAFATNVQRAAKSDVLLFKKSVGPILWTLGRLQPDACPKVFNALKAADPSLDGFAASFLNDGWDSSKGQSYRLTTEDGLSDAYCSLDTLKKHARGRLKDPALNYPVRAVWQAVLEGKRLYGVDGTEVIR